MIPLAFLDGFDWKSGGLLLLGMVLMKIFNWIGGWMDGKGKEWINERFTKLQEAINTNSVAAQIQLDDALVTMVRDSIPEVLEELSATARKDLADGKFDKTDWEGIGGKLWTRIKPQVEGGKNDYLKDSSFEDGKALATWVAKKFFKKQKAKKEGVVTE